MGKLRKSQNYDEGGDDIDLDSPSPGLSNLTKFGLFGLLFVLPALQFALMIIDPVMNQLAVTTFNVKRDEDALKRVLYGGEPWMVLCKNETDTTEIWSQFLDAARELSGTASAAVTDCYAPLPQSGKTLAEKFKFHHPSTWEPLVFLCANGGKPKQVHRNVYASKEGIVGYVAKEVTPRFHRISNDKQLGNLCTKRKSCVVIYRKDKLAESEQSTIQGLMQRNRAVSFVVVNSRKLRLSLEGKFEGVDDPVVVMFKKVSQPAPVKVEVELVEDNEPVDVDSLMDSLLEEDTLEDDTGAGLVSGNDEQGLEGGPKPGLYAKLYRGGDFDVVPVSEFIEDFLVEENLEPLPRTPSLKARPKAKPTPKPSQPPKSSQSPKREKRNTNERQSEPDEDDAETDARKDEFWQQQEERKQKRPEFDNLFVEVEDGAIEEEDAYEYDDEVLFL